MEAGVSGYTTWRQGCRDNIACHQDQSEHREAQLHNMEAGVSEWVEAGREPSDSAAVILFSINQTSAL
eukprot:1138116-Pelagomonas_calceolata.AAC.1